MPLNTKILSALVGLALGMLSVRYGVVAETAQAFGGDPGAAVDDTFTTLLIQIIVVITVLGLLGMIALHLMSWLIEPSAIIGLTDTAGGTFQVLNSLWQVSRDIMNLIFAIMLLVGAVLTIVFGKQQFIKEHLVKFLLAVVLVNFSWFFPRVIIDVANVTTATVYSLPNLVGAPCGWIDGNGLTQPCVGLVDLKFFEHMTDPCPAGSVDLPPWVIAKACVATLDATTNTGYGVLNGLVINHARLPHLGVIIGSLPGGGMPGNAAELLRLAFTLITVGFLYVLLIFPLLGLTAVLLVRIPILWLTVAFMPFMFIGFITGEKFIKVNSMQIFHHFVTAAFIPAIIAVPFSIGFIMLNKIAELNSTGGFAPPADFSRLAEPFPVVNTIGSFWLFIWILMAFAVIWMGAFAAMKSDSIYAKFTEPINRIGTAFLKIPLNTPLPVGISKDGKPIKASFNDIRGNLERTGTPLGIRKPFEQVNDPRQQARQSEVDRVAGQFNAEDVRGLNGGDDAKLTAAIDKLATSLKDEHRTVSAAMDAMRRASAQTGIDLTPATLNKLQQKLKGPSETRFRQE